MSDKKKKNVKVDESAVEESAFDYDKMLKTELIGLLESKDGEIAELNGKCENAKRRYNQLCAKFQNLERVHDGMKEESETLSKRNEWLEEQCSTLSAKIAGYEFRIKKNEDASKLLIDDLTNQLELAKTVHKKCESTHNDELAERDDLIRSKDERIAELEEEISRLTDVSDNRPWWKRIFG